MNWLLNRLKEKSTWLGIFTLLGLLGMKLNPELQELITQAILAVAAIVAFVFRENTLERSTDQYTEPTGKIPLTPIQLIGQAEASAKLVDPAPFVPGAAPDRNRRVTDAWVRDSVPSESQFQHPVQRNEGAVGWNDD